MRVLLAGYRSHPRTGGQGVYLRHLSRALTELGHHVDVISAPPYPDLPGGVGLIKLPSLDLHAAANGLRAFRPRFLASRADLGEWLSHNTGGFAEPWSFGERLAAWVKRTGAAGRYDILHDNQSLAPGLLRIAAMGLPVAGTIHHPITVDRKLEIAHAASLSLRLLKRRWYYFLKMQKRTARDLRHILTPSQSAQRDIAADFGLALRQLEVVPHGVDHGVFRPMPGAARGRRHLITTASADVPLKGLHIFLEACAGLRSRFPDLTATVIGRLRNGAARRIMERHDLGGMIRFVHDLSEEEIARAYAGASAAVAPSLYEGFGFPAAEAMACGVAVVASDGGALPEVVGDAGLIVPRGDVPGLIRSVDRVLSDDGLRAALAGKALARARAAFCWRRAGERTAGFYRKAIADAHRAA